MHGFAEGSGAATGLRTDALAKSINFCNEQRRATAPGYQSEPVGIPDLNAQGLRKSILKCQNSPDPRNQPGAEMPAGTVSVAFEADGPGKLADFPSGAAAFVQLAAVFFRNMELSLFCSGYT